jgi:hypothetical protein
MAENRDSVFFFRTLYKECESGFINLRFIRDPRVENLFVNINELDTIPSIVKAHAGQNAFFGVGLRRLGDGTKNGITEIPALWADLDLGKMTETARADTLARLSGFPLRPSLQVNSGGGRHLYFLLKEPAGPEDIVTVEGLLRRLAAYLGGDRLVCDASHIMRIPGTLNHKYNPPRPVLIEETNV